MTAATSVRTWHPLMWVVIGAILLAPLIAMQFTREVAWTGSDFLFAGILLSVPALLFELVTRNAALARHRGAIGAGLVAIVLIVWAQGAVGIF